MEIPEKDLTQAHKFSSPKLDRFPEICDTILISTDNTEEEYKSAEYYVSMAGTSRQGLSSEPLGTRFHTKKSQVLSLSQIKQFLVDASDNIYLAMKVILIFGFCGALRSGEYCSIKTQDVEETGTQFIVTIRDTKNYYPGSFVIMDEYSDKIRQYVALQPENSNTDRFFILYDKGACKRQPMDKNTIADKPTKHKNSRQQIRVEDDLESVDEDEELQTYEEDAEEEENEDEGEEKYTDGVEDEDDEEVEHTEDEVEDKKQKHTDLTEVDK
ncbi:uncharacterized protein LOC128668222 [Microplitis demolitor]|uniref:uncharacterized protein LOC128668222 n=1 Tax=Microplitis demolitor TaxID=69319 RepID=UPI0004CCFAEC|nr:uncharacterized protein LOC128668222 [Microplitis demolitor]